MTGQRDHHGEPMPRAPIPRWPLELPCVILPTEGNGTVGVEATKDRVKVETAGGAVELTEPEVRALLNLLFTAKARAFPGEYGVRS